MKIHVHVNPATQKGGNLSNEKLLNDNTQQYIHKAAKRF
jgi:hypothetical protein